jgi:hypothetical protein
MFHYTIWREAKPLISDEIEILEDNKQGITFETLYTKSQSMYTLALCTQLKKCNTCEVNPVIYIWRQ